MTKDIRDVSNRPSADANGFHLGPKHFGLLFANQIMPKESACHKLHLKYGPQTLKAHL